mmetsp:Transcript_469/g.452  ORF Transcript_469/g.452 Transcript_469/m.452 type:complete len:201 (-) Transcript_469:8-610(-)
MKVRKMTTPSGFRTRQTFKLPPRPLKKRTKQRKHSNKLKFIIQKADNYLKESPIEMQSQRKSRSVNPRKKYKRPSWLHIQDNSEIRNRKLITLYSSTTHEIDNTEAEMNPPDPSWTSHDTSALGLSYQKNQHTRSESFGSQSSITGRKTEKKRSRFMNKPAGVDQDEVLEGSTRRKLWTKNTVSKKINHIKLSSLFRMKR